MPYERLENWGARKFVHKSAIFGLYRLKKRSKTRSKRIFKRCKIHNLLQILGMSRSDPDAAATDHPRQRGFQSLRSFETHPMRPPDRSSSRAAIWSAVAERSGDTAFACGGAAPCPEGTGPCEDRKKEKRRVAKSPAPRRAKAVSTLRSATALHRLWPIRVGGL